MRLLNWISVPARGALIAAIALVLPVMAQSWEEARTTRLVGDDRSVSVSAGQSLYDVARANGYALEHLAEANGLPVSLAAINRSSVTIPSRRIVPDDPPENGIIVNLPERGFYVFRKGETTRFFPIAVGQPGRFETPTGKYTIREKVENPEWVAPEWAGLGEENVIPAGPDNPLGDRWIGLSASGLGMHSTNNPSSIGSATSHGCMRMYPEIARTVFDLVQTGWPVTIQYETSRVSLENDGIYIVCFPDPYKRGNRKNALRESFQKLDLGGFFDLVQVDRALKDTTGLVTRVVDLEPRVSTLDGKTYPAARIGQKVYVEGGALEAMGIRQEFRLAEKAVVLTRGSRSFTLPIRLSDKDGSIAGGAFLSRGAAWFPAREVLQPLSVVYRWEGADKTIRIESPNPEREG